VESPPAAAKWHTPRVPLGHYAAPMSALAERALATLSTDATDPVERGRAAGAALAERAAFCLAAYLPLFADLGHGIDDVRRFGLRVLERAERWHPPIAAELEAFALGARLEPELVAALNGRTELLALAECTTVGRCESSEGPWLAQNWDWYADAPERCLVWSAAVEGARFATMTEAGILAKVGVSTRGIAVALNILYHARDGRGELGVPVHLVLRRLLGEAAGVEDAWALLRETPYSASSCITVVDAAGGGACFELSPAGVARIEPRDGLLAHTNHFLDSELAQNEAEQPAEWLPGSRGRLAAAERAAPPELGDALALLGSHSSEPQAICRHDEPPGEPGRPLVDTVVSLAMRPGVPELRVAAGQPCECAFLGYAL
jgi:isopenicillin-N N-acyltransferase like protein